MNRSTKEYGWSSGPLEFQTAFVVLVVMFGLLLFIGLLWRLRKGWHSIIMICNADFRLCAF
jgi:hypothetical protein